jgi:hypothetical protein
MISKRCQTRDGQGLVYAKCDFNDPVWQHHYINTHSRRTLLCRYTVVYSRIKARTELINFRITIRKLSWFIKSLYVCVYVFPHVCGLISQRIWMKLWKSIWSIIKVGTCQINEQIEHFYCFITIPLFDHSKFFDVWCFINILSYSMPNMKKFG